MPLVEVTHNADVSPEALQRLAECLPHLVSVAVECPEEPYVGDLQPGDVDIRFRERGPLDRGGLPVVIEVWSKWFASRASDRQQRCDRLHGAIASQVGLEDFGIYLALPVAAWTQGE